MAQRIMAQRTMKQAAKSRATGSQATRMRATGVSAVKSLPLLGLIGLMACGCSSVGKALGLERVTPDEFAVTTKAPLELPPDFALRPPAPGKSRPQELSPSDRARQLLLGDSAESPPSIGEQAFLQQIDALNVDPSIRVLLDSENGARAVKEANFANRLLFWRINEDGSIDDRAAPLVMDDTETWLNEREESINRVTGGEKVTISKKNRALVLPGVR